MYVWSSLIIIIAEYVLVVTGMVANPARGELNRKKKNPCPCSRLRIWPREKTESAVPSRVSPLMLSTQAESGAYSRDSSRFLRDGVNRHMIYLVEPISSTAI